MDRRPTDLGSVPFPTAAVPKRHPLSIQTLGFSEHVGARCSQVTKFDSIIDCNLLGSVAEGSAAVTTLNGVGSVTDVSEIVTQSPSVENAELMEYAVMIRYTPEERGLFAHVIDVSL